MHEIHQIDYTAEAELFACNLYWPFYEWRGFLPPLWQKVHFCGILLHTKSKEVVGLNFILWLIAVSALPLILIWNNRCRYTLLRQLRTPGQRIRSLAVVVLAGIMVWAPIRLLDIQQKKVERATGVDLPSYGGVVANSYLPSNWLSALGLYAWARVDESSDNNSLLNPAKKFTYQAPQNVDDTYVVFIIGETTRWDHMGIFGYERNTTPKLAQEKNLAAFRGYSCDTATKLSLRCMFVRQGGAEDNPQRTLKEQNIFAVLKQLGFSSDLYAMQSEMWFYSNTMADNIAYREQIGAEPRNRGKPVDDMLLVDEMQQSLGRNPDGKHLIILHTKGSHLTTPSVTRAALRSGSRNVLVLIAAVPKRR